ncbi:polysaccharide deacetylase family protein [Patescibacteria group bacterium]|nr:polysaccharide deacetylase family protein [Patescibacteria group bacterium]MBU1613315.1 polysaccharide deacetylase family protein [Patescibacteria group bacterium]
MEEKICFLTIDAEEDWANGRTIESCEGIKNLELLDSVLEKNRIKPTFFCTGKVLLNFGSIVRKYFEEGCEVGIHGFFDHVNLQIQERIKREEKLEQHVSVFKNLLGENPAGFRAVQNTMDNEAIALLEKKGFLFDSSVISRYPLFKKYIGYPGPAPRSPYYPDANNYLSKGDGKIMEIPLNPLLFGVQLQGKWIRELGANFFVNWMKIFKPNFLSLSFHSWDLWERTPKGGQSFVNALEIICGHLKKHGYIFLSGRKIYERFKCKV